MSHLRCVELTAEWEAELQRFFEANPGYFLDVNGEPPRPNEAHEELTGEPPREWGFTRVWQIGYVDASDSIVAMAGVVSDLLAAGIWHIGFFIVATERHGSGEARTLYQGLESWARTSGATWLRLGVVRGNARAERFWESLGYVQVRTREGAVMGKRTNTVRVMIKPLTNGTREQYLDLVPRDRPEPLQQEA